MPSFGKWLIPFVASVVMALIALAQHAGITHGIPDDWKAIIWLSTIASITIIVLTALVVIVSQKHKK